MEGKLDGERYYRAAVVLTDANPGTQFKTMLSHDSRVSQLERLYFRGEWRELPLYGWNEFSLKMEEDSQKLWLAKIKELDGNVVVDYLEDQLMQASRDGKSPNRAALEATVKALQGVSALTRINTESGESGGAGEIEVRFIPSLAEPIEPEKLEDFLARLKRSSGDKAEGA